MARSRRLPAAFLLSLALAALVAAATVAGGGERRVAFPGAGGAGAALQGHPAEPALTPAKRQSAEPFAFVVVAVLATLLGLAAATGSFGRMAEPQWVLPAVRRRAVRLRGPPALLLPS